MAILAQI